jgi:hypothetical protein
MVFSILMILLLASSYYSTEMSVDAFVSSGTSSLVISSRSRSRRPQQRQTTAGGILQSTAAPLRQEASSSSSSSSSFNAFKSLQEFNAHIEKLAEKCGSFKEPVIARAAQCQQVWEATMDRHNDDDDHARDFDPDLTSFRTVLTAWSKCTHTLAKSRRDHKTLPVDTTTQVDVYTPLDAAKRGTSLLLAYDQPDLTSYNIILDAWSKSRVPEATDAAERLLRRMLEDESIEPNTVTYNLLMDTWANSDKPNSLDKVRQIYKHMESLHSDGNVHVSPSIRTINSVLHAHAKKAAQCTKKSNKEGFDEAEECATAAYKIFQDAKNRYEETNDPEWQPDVATYTSCIDVHARAATYNSARIAEKVLHELKDMYAKTGNQKYKLNYRTYTSVVTAWSRTRSDESPNRVEALLVEMSQDPATKPNSWTYTAAVQCWARSRDPLKAKRVLKILMDMREEYKNTGREEVLPTTITYNNAIDACARCQGTEQQKTEAMKIAFAILKTIEMDEHAEPDAATYSTLLRAVSFLMGAGPERNKVAKAVFEKAKKGGLVEFNAVRNLRRVVDAAVMREALEGRADRNGVFDYTTLPLQWSRNVKE